MNTDVKNVPSPFEIESKKTKNGGWTRYDLALWGVPWEPPKGWKEELEKAYAHGFTVGLIQACDVCGVAVYSTEYESYCLCNNHKEVRRGFEPVEKVLHTPTFREIVTAAFGKKPKSKPKKEPIPADLRWAVWNRDNFTCKHCGSREHLSIDHIIPESKGGKLTMENTQTLCKSCNSRKGAR